MTGGAGSGSARARRKSASVEAMPHGPAATEPVASLRITAEEEDEGLPKYANRSVERALDILVFLHEYRRPARITDICKGTGLSPGTAYRLLAVLVGRRFAYKNSITRRYSLGFETFYIGATSRAMRMTSGRAHPLLVQLARDVGASVFFGAQAGSQVVLLDRVLGREETGRVAARIGTYVDAHATAIGKVLLAWQRDSETREVFRERGLEAHTLKTITTVPSLIAELQRVRARGWAVDDGEFRPGMFGIAVPIISLRDEVNLAIWMVHAGGAPDEAETLDRVRRAEAVAKAISDYRPVV